MTAGTAPENCPKFTLDLKSRTPEKKIREARQKLEGLYPFEVNAKNILMLKTGIKGRYDVYLSKEEIKRTLNAGKICPAVIAVLFILAAAASAFHHASLKRAETLRTQKETEMQERQEEAARKQKEEKLSALKKEYYGKKSLEYEKIYPCMERIYSVMTEKAAVENILIQKNSFTVEVTADDAVTILSNFEGSSAFKAVRMNRTTVKDGGETVTYSGEFSRFINGPDEKSGIDGKISFYETELLKMQARLEARQNMTVSECIKKIRSVLHKNSCSEQYIQLKGNGRNAEIEFLMLSGSMDMLNFIKEIQQGEENLIDIKSFAVRNGGNRNRIQTTVCLDTGTELKQDDPVLHEYICRETELSEMDRLFKKPAPEKKQAAKTESVRNGGVTAKAGENFTQIKLKKLSYVGLAKSGGKNFVIAKDEKTGSIYKLVLSDTETDGNSCVQSDGGYRAKIRGEYYEVKK